MQACLLGQRNTHAQSARTGDRAAVDADNLIAALNLSGRARRGRGRLVERRRHCAPTDRRDVNAGAVGYARGGRWGNVSLSIHLGLNAAGRARRSEGEEAAVAAACASLPKGSGKRRPKEGEGLRCRLSAFLRHTHTHAHSLSLPRSARGRPWPPWLGLLRLLPHVTSSAAAAESATRSVLCEVASVGGRGGALFPRSPPLLRAPPPRARPMLPSSLRGSDTRSTGCCAAIYRPVQRSEGGRKSKHDGRASNGVARDTARRRERERERGTA